MEDKLGLWYNTKNMGLLNNFSQSLKNILKPADKNSMFANLGRPFSRWSRNEPLVGDWSQVIMSEQDNYKGFSYGAINVRSNLVYRIAKENIYAEAKPEIMDNLDGGEVIEHPYLQLIKFNKNFSEGDFWRSSSTFLDLKGIMYYLVVRNYQNGRYGDIQSMRLLNPYHVQRVIDPTTNEVGGYIESRGSLQRSLPPEMVIEVRLPEPFTYNGFYAPTQAAEDHQFALKTASNYQNKSLNKNINSTGIISTDVVFNNEEEYRNWKRKMLEKGRQGEPLFTDGAGNLKYQDMQIDLNRAALKSVHEVNKETITAIYGTSNTIMGIERSGVTRDTARVQKDIIVQNHIVPRIELVLDALNLDYMAHYPNQWEKQRVMLTCADPTALDNAANSKLMDVKEKQLTIYTRLIGYGYEPNVAGKYANDEIDIDELGEPVNEPTTTPRPGRMPSDELVEEPEHPNNSFQPSKKKSSTLTSDENRIACCNNPEIQKMTNAVTLEPSSPENLNIAALESAITNLEATIVQHAIDKLSEDDLSEDFATFEPLTTKQANEETKALQAVLALFYATIFFSRGNTNMGERVAELALTKGQFSMSSAVRSWITKMSREAAKSHVSTITKDIIATAQRLAKEGQSITQIRSGLLELYQGKITQQRAKVIARTESFRVANEAIYQADLQLQDQNPQLKGKLYKQWVTSGLPTVCEFCRQLESEGAIPLDQPFRSLGSTIDVHIERDGTLELKSLEVDYTSLYAGNAHPSCMCTYRLIIRED